MRRFVVLAVLFVVASSCRGELHQEDGNVEVRVALTKDGLRVLDMNDVGALSNPPVQGQSLQFTFRANEGDVVEGRVADSRTLRSEFDRAGQPDPRTLVADFGVVDLRVPTRAGILELRDGEGTAIGELALDPEKPSVKRSALMEAADVLGSPVKIVDHGASDRKVDILFLPEGYTEAELGEFHAHVDFIVDQIKGHSGYREHWTGFNVWRQDVRSRTSGTGSNGRAIDTAFDTAAGIAGLNRCVFFTNPEGQEAAMQLARSAGADATVVLVNSTQYGGCAGDEVVVSARPRGVADIVGHELGHALFGLADEYETPRPNATCSVGPNVSFWARADTLPWADMVNTLQLPTPPSADFGTIGAFEGAGYCARGRYRPTHNCMMRTLGTGMCPVCKREVARTMAALAPGGSEDIDRVTLVNAAEEALWVRCDGAESVVCSDWVFLPPDGRTSLNATGRRVVLQSIEPSTLFETRRATVPSDEATIYANTTDPFSPPAPTPDPLTPPRELSPDLAELDTPDVTLTWSHDGGVRYFVSVEMETPGGWALFSSIESRTESVTIALGGVDARYRWSVEACNDGGCVRSLQAVFEHDAPGSGPTQPTEPSDPDASNLPAIPGELQPTHEAVVPMGSLTLEWEGQPEASYAVNVRVHDPVLGWIEHAQEFGLQNPSVAVTLDIPNTWYAWTVQSCTDRGCSPWTEYSLVATQP